MKKKLLCCALLAGMSMAQSAVAQDYDDRWYISAGAGIFMPDEDRNANDDRYGMLGLGKFVSPNISIDAELFHTNPVLDQTGPEKNWELLSLSIVGRYHFVKDGRDTNPYIALGLGAQEHHDDTLTFLSSRRTGTAVTALAGVGVQTDIGYGYLRAEIGARWDSDDENPNDDSYTDGYAGVSFLFPIGAEAAPAPEPTPIPQKTCADLDDDGDGVNNCNDQCPATPAGEAVGPNGCPVPVQEPEPVLEPKPFRG